MKKETSKSEELENQILELKKQNHILEQKLFAKWSDISIKNESDALIEHNQKNFETFFNSIPDFLFVLDEQACIINCNATVIHRLGYTLEELTGKSVLMIHPAERRDEAGRIVGEMLCGKADFCPVPIITKSGTQIPVETRVSHGIWNNKPVLFGVTKDISRLVLSEEKFSKVFYLNPSACGLSDLENQQYVEVNEAFYALFGFNKNEVIGKTAMELNLFSQEARMALLQKTNSNGNIISAEVGLKAKNGDIKQVLLSSENIYVQDKKYRFTVVHDITELNHAKEIINHQNKDLQKLNSEKDKFFSIIAHDLKSPFFSIVGFSEILREQVKKKDFTGIEKYAKIILNSSQKAMNLLTNILEWSQSQSGRIEFIPEYFELDAHINETLACFTDIAGAKSIIIKSLLSSKMPVFADKAMISTVLRNLISNAIKFTNPGGEILISLEKRKDEFVISVKDNGVGISKNKREKLFRIDSSFSTSGTQNEQGTGLGLILCKEFVGKHKGKIWLESELGKGSCFSFTILDNNVL